MEAYPKRQIVREKITVRLKTLLLFFQVAAAEAEKVIFTTMSLK